MRNLRKVVRFPLTLSLSKGAAIVRQACPEGSRRAHHERLVNGTGESGQILAVTLVVLLLASLVAVPLVDSMHAGLQAVRIYHEKTIRIYAADAGIQNAVWKVASGEVPQDTSFSMTYPAMTVNGKDTVIKVNGIWILNGIVSSRFGPHDVWVDLTTTGNPSTNGTYLIDFYYVGNPGNKRIEDMGVWMPNFVSYVPGSAALFPGNITTAEPAISSINGGWSIKWSGLAFSLRGNTHYSQQFKFSPPDKPLSGDVAWAMSQSQDIGVSYDRMIYDYTVTSTATDNATLGRTTVVAHVSKDVGPTPGVAIATYEIDPAGT